MYRNISWVAFWFGWEHSQRRSKCGPNWPTQYLAPSTFCDYVLLYSCVTEFRFLYRGDYHYTTRYCHNLVDMVYIVRSDIIEQIDLFLCSLQNIIAKNRILFTSSGRLNKTGPDQAVIYKHLILFTYFFGWKSANFSLLS